METSKLEETKEILKNKEEKEDSVRLSDKDNEEKEELEEDQLAYLQTPVRNTRKNSESSIEIIRLNKPHKNSVSNSSSNNEREGIEHTPQHSDAKEKMDTRIEITVDEQESENILTTQNQLANSRLSSKIDEHFDTSHQDLSDNRSGGSLEGGSTSQ